MLPSVYMAQGDLLPILSATLNNVVNNVTTPMNLAGCTVSFTMTSTTAPQKIFINAQSCAIVSASLGEVSYTWQAGDTATAGLYYGQFAVTNGSSTWHVPNQAPFVIQITTVI